MHGIWTSGHPALEEVVAFLETDEHVKVVAFDSAVEEWTLMKNGSPGLLMHTAASIAGTGMKELKPRSWAVAALPSFFYNLALFV